MRKTIAITAVAVLLTACASLVEPLFGPAETDDQRAFRAAAIYSYVATPVRSYVHLPVADQDVVRKVCEIDQFSYEGFMAAVESLRAGGDFKQALLSATARAFTSYSLFVLDQTDPLSSPYDVPRKTAIMIAVGADAVSEMIAWRKGYVEPKMEALVELGADPNQQEWEEVLGRAEKLHASVQERCPDFVPIIPESEPVPEVSSDS